MEHLKYTYNHVLDRFFDPKWGPWNTQETKDGIKELYKEAMDYAKNMMDDRDGLLKENRLLKDQKFELATKIRELEYELYLDRFETCKRYLKGKPHRSSDKVG